jgi:excisionase family DNA binding protein
MPNRLLTTREMVDLLQLDRVTIYKMVKRGELPALRVGGQWRFSGEAIAAWLQARNGERPANPDLRDTADALAIPLLTDLVPVKTLRSIQDQFAELLGVSSFTIDTNGQPVIPCSRCSRFCQLVHSTEAGWAACVASWRQIAQSEQEGAIIHTCHAGIHYATAPIVVGGQRVGMVTAGQFLSAAVDPVTFRERALATGARIGVDGEALAEAQDAIEIVSEERALQITGLLATIANSLSGIGYQNSLVRQKLAQIAELTGAALATNTD